MCLRRLDTEQAHLQEDTMEQYNLWLEARDEIAHIIRSLDEKMTPEESQARATRALPPAPPIDGEEIVTEALIESLRSANGGFTAEALASIGIKWPAPHGWPQMILGKPRVRVPLSPKMQWRNERDRIAKQFQAENPGMKWNRACDLAMEQIGPSRTYKPKE
jgi:hypothetical protein